MDKINSFILYNTRDDVETDDDKTDNEMTFET